MNSADQQILDLMQHNAALSVGDIANKVGISKSACWRRIQKLEETGVILQRVTLLDQHKINLPLTAFISIHTNQHNDKWFKQFKKVTDALPEILEVYRMSGDLDYLIKAVVTDMPGYDRLYKQLVTANLFDVSSSFVMETMKYKTQMPLDYVTKG